MCSLWQLLVSNLNYFLCHETKTIFILSITLLGGLLLDHNQWICTCENAWLGHWLKRWYLETTSIRHPISMLPLNAVSCRDPISLKRKNLVSWSRHQFSLDKQYFVLFKHVICLGGLTFKREYVCICDIKSHTAEEAAAKY